MLIGFRSLNVNKKSPINHGGFTWFLKFHAFIDFHTAPGIFILIMNELKTKPDSEAKRFGCLHILGTALIILVVLGLCTLLWVKRNVYASPFTPTMLDLKEQKILDSKLSRLEMSAFEDQRESKSASNNSSKNPEPVPYTEDDSKRQIRISEKELNAIIAKDPEIASRIAIDLSRDLMSFNIILPIEKDFPILGGKTLRIKAGINLSYKNGKPVVAIRGISLGGVPLPGAWWGDIKNKNLVEEFSGEGGFWSQFSKGVEDIKISEGHLLVKLKK